MEYFKPEDFEKVQGVEIMKLKPGTKLEVYTKNTLYEIEKIDFGDNFYAQGGKHLQKRKKIKLHGSTYGGSAIKIDYIGLNMQMEFAIGKERIITTSPIEKIKVVGDGWHYEIN